MKYTKLLSETETKRKREYTYKLIDRMQYGKLPASAHAEYSSMDKTVKKLCKSLQITLNARDNLNASAEG